MPKMTNGMNIDKKVSTDVKGLITRQPANSPIVPAQRS